MRLPGAESAVVPVEKLTGYLLSLAHPVGRSKAVFFRALGYDETNAELLTAGLTSIVADNEVAETEATEFGTKYAVEGTLVTPSGVTTSLRTVWILRSGEATPRFVTAYPA
ncbi:MAG TPA: hypothetical protein VFG68_04975 [Fimbriiglobus sp.]|nr:hypothetical protein [Fimbriiglobus sp.]